MTQYELIAILRLVAQSAPQIMSLIERMRDGEEIEVDDAELEAGTQLVRRAVQRWNNTPAGGAG